MIAPVNRPSLRYAALLELLRAAESLWQASRVFFAQWHLSPSQFNVLNLLYHESQGLSQSDLSRELITHRSNVSGLVDRLESRGLVARKERATDRRAWRVVLTADGRALVTTILPVYHQVAEEVWGEFAPDRAASLIDDLRHLEGRAGWVAERYAAPEAAASTTSPQKQPR